ncbi:MAG: 16S rRNA (adenine(1518)-N(6)/adenine(1519)-N(6))-dimethyltransferase RsmA [Clostridiales bacterium]|jgi:16S rRNA (adenine1518-N6/adenine1519-N6)-dimethyltransferase|nr:16S rRNA (adenine(1518)-N(6)/adenine(1519)-N(6))-dimethyltransferase RsmA [Clostridiales bacterium]
MTPSETKRVMVENGFTAKKRLGQNFLVDERILDKIIKAADIGANDTILEIGPGMGALTRKLAERAGQVLAIEIDGTLAEILEKTMSDRENVKIIRADALKADFREFIQDFTRAKAVANLPYCVATPIIMKLLEFNFREIIVMVQKEVAERILASPGEKNYGSLTLAARYEANAEIVTYVPPNCFMPRPNVNSAVIRLSPRLEKPVSPKNKDLMFSVIRTAFSTRRKTLLNCLSRRWPKDDLREILKICGLDENTRGERLSLEDFARLSDALKI